MFNSIEWAWEEWGSWTDCWKEKGDQTIHNGQSQCTQRRYKQCNLAKSETASQENQDHWNDDENCSK